MNHRTSQSASAVIGHQKAENASPDYLTRLGYEYDNVQRELDRVAPGRPLWHVLMDRAENIRRQMRAAS